MAARVPRRSFANPFVVTLAALPGCYTSAEPPPGGAAEVVTPTNPPAPTVARPPPAAAGEQRWTVYKVGDGCEAVMRVDCPKAAPGMPAPTCNPPPPVKYDCPEGLAAGAPFVVVRPAGRAECEKESRPPACPPDASCNPPPPVKLACPEP
jgi:hypothetical protein